MVATLADNGLLFPFQLHYLEDVHRQTCLHLVLDIFDRGWMEKVWNLFFKTCMNPVLCVIAGVLQTEGSASCDQTSGAAGDV
jgi:hypothetical protein